MYISWCKTLLQPFAGSTFCSMWGITALTLLWAAAVFPSPPDFCSPLLLPECQSEATSSFSQTNLSGHNRLPLQLCCFWNENPSGPLVLPLGWQKLAKKTFFFEGFISADCRCCVFSQGVVYFHSSMWKLCDHGHPAGDLFKMWSYSSWLSPSMFLITRVEA